MEWRDLGSSGLRLPAIGLGAHRAYDVNGREAQLARSSLTQSVIQNGTPLFHTSDEYGEASRVLGASLLPARKRALVMTSIGAREWRAGQRYIDRSLHYFDGYVDFCAYAFPGSGPDYRTAVTRLRDRGEVRAVGVRLTERPDYPAVRHHLQFQQPDYIEIPYAPDDDPDRERLIAFAHQLGVGVVAVAPFRGGRLARLHPPSANLRTFEAVGVNTWPQLIVKWVLSNRHVTSVIIGTRRTARLRSFVDVAGPPWLSSEDRKRVLLTLGGMRRQ